MESGSCGIFATGQQQTAAIVAGGFDESIALRHRNPSAFVGQVHRAGQLRRCLKSDVRFQATAALADMPEETGRGILVQFPQQFAWQTQASLSTVIPAGGLHSRVDHRSVHGITSSFCRSFSIAFCFRRVTA